MALKRGEVNPLGILNLRKLGFIPDHFSRIKVRTTDIKLLTQWINYNLNSRYAIKKAYNTNARQFQISVETIEIGMEDPSEITMLILGCPHLHNT
jgi:hypothetical protein